MVAPSVVAPPTELPLPAAPAVVLETVDAPPLDTDEVVPIVPPTVPAVTDPTAFEETVFEEVVAELTEELSVVPATLEVAPPEAVVPPPPTLPSPQPRTHAQNANRYTGCKVIE